MTASPIVDLSINGVPSGLFLGSGLLSLSYRDVHHGESDELSFSVADPNGIWRSGWFIEEGTPVSAVIGFQIGLRVHCGDFVIEEPEAELGSGGHTMTFKALAAYTSKALRTERSEGYDNMSLQDVVAKVAARNGLKPLYKGPALKFRRLSQSKQSDLAFLTRLAEDWGFYFSIKGTQLIFMDRTAVESATPVRILAVVSGEATKNARLRRSSAGCYRKAELSYLDPKSGKKIKVTAEDARVKSDDTLKLDDKVENREQAERLCAAKLAAANDGFATGTVEVVGDPMLVAGQIITLLPLAYGAYAGRWLVTESTHDLGPGGYSTTLTIKGVKDA